MLMVPEADQAPQDLPGICMRSNIKYEFMMAIITRTGCYMVKRDIYLAIVAI